MNSSGFRRLVRALTGSQSLERKHTFTPSRTPHLRLSVLLLTLLSAQNSVAELYRFDLKTVFLSLAGVIDTTADTMEIRQWRSLQPQFALAPEAPGTPSGCLPSFAHFIHLSTSTDLPDGGGQVLTSAPYIAAQSNSDIFTTWYQQENNASGVSVSDTNNNIHFGINASSLGNMKGFIAGLTAISGSGFVSDGIYVPDFIVATPEEGETLCGELIISGDSDGDQVADDTDLDDDNDGILDTHEGADSGIDTDGDLIPDSRDLDSDGDLVPDAIEGHDSNQDGIADRHPAFQDSDHDGLDDRFDPDCTGANCDGIIGVAASRQNSGGNSKPDFQDPDDDGDGFTTLNERPFALDSDGDGTPDYLDPDQGQDRDGDQIPDTSDTDDDGDGIRDSVEGSRDSDNDGIIDRLDTDSDNDNVPDSIEAFDLDHDGIADIQPIDPDFLTDSDGDGLDDAYDLNCTGQNCGGTLGIDAPLPNTDGDALPDYRDSDDDDDGLLTAPDEDRDGDGNPSNDDTDNDGTPDYLDDSTYVALEAKVLLQGSMEANPLTAEKTDGLMRSALRDQNGLSIIPLNEPYTDLADFQHTNLGGGETAQAYVFEPAGPSTIVDWVFVSLLDSGQNVVATRAALLQRDGDIVDIDGQPPLIFDNVTLGEYTISIRHRNHLGVMNANPLSLSATPTLVDFTNLPDNLAFHNSENHPAQIKLGEHHNGLSGYGPNTLGKMALWAGNAAHRIEAENPSSSVRELLTLQGQNNDRDQILVDVVTHPLNTTFSSTFIARGYKLGDINMNGQATAAGIDIDSYLLLLNILAHPLNAEGLFNFVVYEQLP